MGEVLEAIADPVNLRLAWAKVGRVNQGAGGVDRQPIAAFGADVEHQLASLWNRLLSAQRYVQPVRQTGGWPSSTSSASSTTCVMPACCGKWPRSSMTSK